MSLKFLGLLLLSLSPMLQAQELYLSVLGGGGEPKRDTTLFDEGLEALGNFRQKNPSVKTTLAFNGNHRVTESIAQEKFGSSTPFTSQNLNAIIADYERKIRNGEIKPNDKLLLYVNTHGASKTNVETSHGIAMSGATFTNFDSFGGPSVMSMDSFKGLADLARQKGVRLGIVDLSCHSGNSQALANSGTCVISGTGPNHYAGAGSLSFGTLFSKEIAKGKSLEEIFLAAKARHTDTSFPMISSPAGQDVTKRLYDLITPYLYYYNPTGDKFTPYMENLDSGNVCKLDSGFESLTTEINNILRLTLDNATRASITKFQGAIRDYYTFMKDVENQMKSAGISELNKSFKFCSSGECIDYSVKNLMTTNFDNIIQYYSSQNDKDSRAYAANARAAMAKRDELLSVSPGLRNANTFWSSYPSLITKTSSLQSKVAASQHKLYQELYQRSQASGPNPCRDFVL